MTQLCEATSEQFAPEHRGAAITVSFPNGHVLLGTCMFSDELSNYLTDIWHQHEKLCVIDQVIAFMGGLDACFGR